MTDDVFGSSEALRELTIHDRHGQFIGRVSHVYVDDWDRRPQWVTVRTGMHGFEETFVPLAGAEHEIGRDTGGGVLRVAYDLDTIKAAPREDAEQHLGLDQEQELYAHYGLLPPEGQASGAPGVGADRPTAPLTGHDEGMDDIQELSDDPAPAPTRSRLRKATPAETTPPASTPSEPPTPAEPPAPSEPPTPSEPAASSETPTPTPEATSSTPPPPPAPDDRS
ncbi:PRC-barrel domain-containing protein [Streptomyces sp. NPDC088910]|uniref:PRC-barrel domain-containing protein n=1 Tax=Streptomyces sp. NPDC088910 TaxID=3365911 RepID=UPI0038024FFE